MLLTIFAKFYNFSYSDWSKLYLYGNDKSWENSILAKEFKEYFAAKKFIMFKHTGEASDNALDICLTISEKSFLIEARLFFVVYVVTFCQNLFSILNCWYLICAVALGIGNEDFNDQIGLKIIFDLHCISKDASSNRMHHLLSKSWFSWRLLLWHT